MTEENCHIPLNPIYQNVPQERRLINHNSFDSFEEAEDDRLYESIGSLPQENQLQNCNEDNNQENNYNRFHVSPFMIPLLIVEICLSFVDFTSDFLNGYSLFKSEDNRSSWGVGSLVVNWIPGVLAVIQIIANHRCDKIHKIIPCSLAILILCPFIPTFSFLFLLYKAPRNSEEDQSREFVRNYTKLLSFVTLVRALEGCIESPLQILYKFSMMFNGVIEFNLANVEVSFHDLQGNTIPVPFFINFLVSSACLLKSVYGLNMQCFKTGTSDNSFAKLEMLDFVAFLVTTTLFKLASTILLVGYFSLFSALPFVVTLFFGIYINSSTIRDERKIPNWLIVFMNLFVPICFTTDDSKDISCVQEKNLKLQTWNCAIVYGFSLIILGLLVNFSMYHMDPDIPISYMMFKTFIVSTLVLGILAMIFSIRMKILEEMSKKKKFFLAMIKIIRILTLSSAFVLFGIFVSMFPLKNPTLKVKFSDESIFEGRVIVPLREKILNISMKDVRIIHGEDFEKEFEGIVLNSHPKLLIVLNNKEEQPSSPAPFVNDLGVPTLLIKKEDRSKFSKISNSSESFQIYSSLEKEGRPQFKDDSRLKKSSDESESIGSKVIYFTGADSRSVQVIDMKSPNVSCDGFKELPVHVNGAVGGRIGSNYIYCGGMVFSEKGDTSSIKMCYIIGNEKPFMDMREARFAASAVVLPKNNTLFITGKSSSLVPYELCIYRTGVISTRGYYIFTLNQCGYNSRVY